MSLRPTRPGTIPAKHANTNFPDDLPRLAPRKIDSHKGDFGHCLIVGGSFGMAGAPALSAMAALRCGTGLVRVAVPRCCVSTVASFEPSYMTAPLPEDTAGRLSLAAADHILALARKATHVVIGPGLGRSPELNQLVVRLYKELPLPAVFDADALNALSDQRDVFQSPGGPRVLTPHPGEYLRLNGNREVGNRGAFQTDARALAAQWKVTIVLKGHRTFVTDGNRSYINNTGNPGMATGGTGDVLSGVIAGLMCQGLVAYDAARLGVYVHGHAGDAAAEEFGALSLIASDLIRYLPTSLQHVVRSVMPT
jgi:NAD(P)H-hydrate epimerase